MDSSVSNVPVGELDARWVRASPLRETALPPAAFEPGESLAEHGASFALTRSFDADPDEESALVGVYRTHDWKRGRFLLILDGDQRALFQHEGEPGFSALWYRDGQLLWSDCMECDVIYALEKKNGVYELRYLGPE